MNYMVLAFYFLDGLENPILTRDSLNSILLKFNSKGRIYISDEGINAQMSIYKNDYAEFEKDFFDLDERFKQIDIKVHFQDDHAFAKLQVKIRDQLCGVGCKVDFSKKGTYLSPKEWDERLKENDDNTILIDVRNDYESVVGHFKGAIKPNLRYFRDFKPYVEQLKKEHGTSKRIMMYCTGGIRCEYYSAMMKEEGFDDVCHLKGGVVGYGLREGGDNWHGNLFVFDDRLVVGINDEATKNPPISNCSLCSTLADTYYNCANMDCNRLFISCSKCSTKHDGCCSQTCQDEGRVRAFSPSAHKPFRKLSYAEKQRLLNPN